jgi:hypothetical protein
MNACCGPQVHPNEYRHVRVHVQMRFPFFLGMKIGAGQWLIPVFRALKELPA